MVNFRRKLAVVFHWEPWSISKLLEPFFILFLSCIFAFGTLSFLQFLLEGPLLSLRTGTGKRANLAVTDAVAPGFKDKTRYTLYVSPGSQISHTATNQGNIKRQYLLHNILLKGK